MISAFKTDGAIFNWMTHIEELIENIASAMLNFSINNVCNNAQACLRYRVLQNVKKVQLILYIYIYMRRYVLNNILD